MILELMLAKGMERITAQGFSLTLTDEAKDFLLEKGFDPHYGARPLQRVIQRYLDDAFAEEILVKRFIRNSGDPALEILVALNNDKTRFELSLIEKEPAVK